MMPGVHLQSFSSLPYSRIDLKKIAEKMRRARLQLRLAMNPDSAIKAVLEGQRAIREYKAMAALAKVRHDMYTGDEYYRGEQQFYDQADAEFDQMRHELYAAMTDSRYRNELKAKFGRHLLLRAENFRQTIATEVVSDLARENKLVSDYNQLIAEGIIKIGDKKYSFGQLSPLLQSNDRETRKIAWQARTIWLQENAEKLDAVFSQMMALRCKIADKLGFSGFPQLALKRMERYDYGFAEIGQLRDNVVRYIVPLTREIRRLQRQRLNLEHLYAYDLPCLFPGGNPQLQCSVDELPHIAARVLGDLTQKPSFLEKMLEGGYVDHKARPDKYPGAYCSTLYGPRQPFILMNATGTARDVFTLMHEAGHAYASLRSLDVFQLQDLHLPALDACEIHSTSLEYLTYPYMDRFFGQAAEEITLMHMTETLLFLPYGCLVDEFQQQIYNCDELSAAKRYSIWRELEQKYLPDIDYDQDQHFAAGGAWQLRKHIYTAPFYYIDYVLAQLAALDIWQQMRIDRAGAYGRYDLLCSLGGSESLESLLEKAALASPFSTNTIKRLAYAVCDFLAL